MRACICTCLLSCEVHESKLIFHHIPFYGCKEWPIYAFLLTWINLYVEASCIDELKSPRDTRNQNVAVMYLYNKIEILYKIWNQIDVLSFHIEFGIIYTTQKVWKFVCVCTWIYTLQFLWKPILGFLLTNIWHCWPNKILQKN